MTHVGNFGNISLYKYSRETKSKPFMLFSALQQYSPLLEAP